MLNPEKQKQKTNKQLSTPCLLAFLKKFTSINVFPLELMTKYLDQTLFLKICLGSSSSYKN